MTTTEVFYAGATLALFSIVILLIAIASHLYNISVSLGELSRRGTVEPGGMHLTGAETPKVVPISPFR